MSRFQSDYETVIRNRCMRVFGFPEDDACKDRRHFDLESHPRVAEIFVESMENVSEC